MSVENPDDILRRMLPNFMHGLDAWMEAHEKLKMEHAFWQAQAERIDDQSDEIETLKAENQSLRAELLRRIADKEIDQ